MKIAKAITIGVALTAGWLAGMATMSWTKASSPRLADLAPAQLDDQQRPIAERILKFSRIGLSGPYSIWLRSPQAAKPIIDLMDYVRFQSAVPNRLREFSILIQGRLWRSQVEWSSHYQPALKAGVSAETLAALRLNKRPSTMQPEEAAVYDFCTELFTRHAVSDQTYANLHKFMNDQQIVDLTVLQGLYVTAAATMAMADQGLPPGLDVAFKPGEP
jgi:4-carboxymuconolactone decarboxylase